MRLITRCPACGTLFKVVPDQLRISEGWVRCGHCAEVFDATTHFHDPEAPAGMSPPELAAEAARQIEVEDERQIEEVEDERNDDSADASRQTDVGFEPFHSSDAPQVAEVSEIGDSRDVSDVSESGDVSDVGVVRNVSEAPEVFESPEPLDDSAQPDHIAEPEPEPEHDEAAAQELQSTPYFESPPQPQVDAEVEPFVEDDAVVAEAFSAAESNVQSSAENPVESSVDHAVESQFDTAELKAEDADTAEALDNADSTDASDNTTDAATPAPTPAFVRQADSRAFWRRPLVRVLMALLLIAALVVLVLQVAFTQRERIAAYLPGARPALVQMCRVLRCEMGALRQIDAIVVDGSSFTRLRTDTYRLGVVLKNNAQVEIAMPSIELELSTVQGRTLVRRVLSPSDMGAAPTLAAGAEWIGEIPVALDAADVASRVAGYAVLPFYP